MISMFEKYQHSYEYTDNIMLGSLFIGLHTAKVFFLTYYKERRF